MGTTGAPTPRRWKDRAASSSCSSPKNKDERSSEVLWDRPPRYQSNHVCLRKGKFWNTDWQSAVYDSPPCWFSVLKKTFGQNWDILILGQTWTEAWIDQKENKTCLDRSRRCYLLHIFTLKPFNMLYNVRIRRTSTSVLWYLLKHLIVVLSDIFFPHCLCYQAGMSHPGNVWPADIFHFSEMWRWACVRMFFWLDWVPCIRLYACV